MKKIIIGLLALASATQIIAQKVPGTANVHDGKVFFIECNPATQYRHIGTVTCGIMSPDKFELMFDHLLKRIAKEFPDAEYDAVIIRPGTAFCKADIVQFYKDPKAKKKRGRKGDEEEIDPELLRSQSIGRGGLNLFIENNPTQDFTLLGKVEIPTNFRSTEFALLVAEMERVARKAYPDLDGIVFVSGTELRKANVIKLK